MRIWSLEAWQPVARAQDHPPSTGQDLNSALGDLVLYNFSANTWERWDLSPAPVWIPPLPCLEAPAHSVSPSKGPSEPPFFPIVTPACSLIEEHLPLHFCYLRFSFLFLKDFICLLLERGEGREKERERNINVWLPLA